VRRQSIRDMVQCLQIGMVIATRCEQHNVATKSPFAFCRSGRYDRLDIGHSLPSDVSIERLALV
jgi:hypothetical protein